MSQLCRNNGPPGKWIFTQLLICNKHWIITSSVTWVPRFNRTVVLNLLPQHARCTLSRGDCNYDHCLISRVWVTVFYCIVLVVRIRSRRLDVKFTISSPLTADQLTHSTALCWPRPSIPAIDMHCSFLLALLHGRKRRGVNVVPSIFSSHNNYRFLELLTWY